MDDAKCRLITLLHNVFFLFFILLCEQSRCIQISNSINNQAVDGS